MPDISCDSFIKVGDNYFKPCGQVQDKPATVKICVKSLAEDWRCVFLADDRKTPQKGTGRAKSLVTGDTQASGTKDPIAVRGGAARGRGRGRGRGVATGGFRGKPAPKSTLASIFDNNSGPAGVAAEAAEQDLDIEVGGQNG